MIAFLFILWKAVYLVSHFLRLAIDDRHASSLKIYFFLYRLCWNSCLFWFTFNIIWIDICLQMETENMATHSQMDQWYVPVMSIAPWSYQCVLTFMFSCKNSLQVFNQLMVVGFFLPSTVGWKIGLLETFRPSAAYIWLFIWHLQWFPT